MISWKVWVLIAALAAATLSPIAFGRGWDRGGAAYAAPIDCPPSQTAEKVADWWTCVNAAGHGNESEDGKNPNGHPNETP